MTQVLTIGYWGNGKSTNRYHLPFLMRRQETIRVKTIYARTLRDEWDRLPGTLYTDDVAVLLNDPEIQVVIVTTPPTSHYEIASQILNAGKHVVLEKPFAHSLAESQALFDLAKEKGLMLQGYQNRRFDSDFITSQAVIASGKLGDLMEVEMHYDYYRPEVPESTASYSKDSSYVYNHASHTVDQALSFFGKPDHVHFDVRQILGKGRMNDYFDLDLYYFTPKNDRYTVTPGGLKVSIKSSYFRVKERPSFVLYGQKGMFVKAEKDRQEADLKKFYLPNHADFGLDGPEHYGTITYYDSDGKFHEEKVPTVQGDNGLYYDALYHSVIHGQAPLVTPEQTLMQMQLLEQATQRLN